MLGKSEQDLFYIKLGEAIKAARKNANCKQQTLANHMGLTMISLVNIEQGKQKIQLHVLLQVAECLNVNIADLIPPLDSIKMHLNAKMERTLKKELEQFESKDDVNQRLRSFVSRAQTKTH